MWPWYRVHITVWYSLFVHYTSIATNKEYSNSIGNHISLLLTKIWVLLIKVQLLLMTRIWLILTKIQLLLTRIWLLLTRIWLLLTKIQLLLTKIHLLLTRIWLLLTRIWLLLTKIQLHTCTIDQNPPTLATTGIDLDARLLAKKHQHLFKLLNITMPCKLYKMKQSVVEHYHNLLVHLYTCLCVCLLLVYYFSSEHGVTIK